MSSFALAIFDVRQERTKLNILNVMTMYQVSKTAQVIKEMDRYEIAIMGVSECRWTVFNSHAIIYSGKSGNQNRGDVEIL